MALSFGNELCILGIVVSVSSRGYRFAPADAKVLKWVAQIQAILESPRSVLLPGDASKLAGQLSWACTNAFRAFGRAMLRPLFDQVSRFDGKISPELRRALSWWDGALQHGIAEIHPWVADKGEQVHLFCDASGKLAKLGAAIRVNGDWYYTCMRAPDELLQQFRHRRDNQIMGLELLAISMGLGTFRWLLEGRYVVVHCDNSGAEVSVRRGTSRAWDHAQLVHSQLLFALRHRMSLFVKRVDTTENIADIPSREDSRQFMWNIGAKFITPMLADGCVDPDSWKVLQERWRLLDTYSRG